MPEIIGYNPLRKKKVEVDPQGESLGRGIDGTVRRVTVSDSEGEKQMAGKFYSEGRKQALWQKIDIEKLLAVHAKLQQLGFPVVPEMYLDRENHSLYTTDLSEGGTKEVLSTSDWSEKIGEDGLPRGKFFGQEKKFILHNPKELSGFFASLFRESVEDDCWVGKKDVFFLTIDKVSSKGDIVLGDLGAIKFLNDSKKKENIIDHNYVVFKDFIEKMNEHIAPEGQLSLKYLDEVYESFKV